MRKSMKRRRIAGNVVAEIALILLSVIWLIPIVWIVLQAFRKEPGALTYTFFPQELTLGNFTTLFKETMFGRWFLNTFFVALASCVLSTIITLMVAYAMSRFRFKARKPFMKIALILGMFPGFLSMIAVYFILKLVGLTGPMAVPGLILVYIGSAGMGYYVSKGFFDTIPRSLDEAARIDGASRSTVFYRIILPLSGPIVIYTVMMAFIAPWGDYMYASLIAFGNESAYNVAVGLYTFLDREHINNYFTVFCAGGLLVAVPVTALFLLLQRYYVEGVTGGAVKG